MLRTQPKKSGGKLPDGLTLDSSGLLHGTLTKAKTYKFKVMASNELGNDTKDFTITVYENIIISTTSFKAATIGKKYSATLKAKGSKPITWSAEGLPEGLEISSSGKISGTPIKRGNYSVKITASNNAGDVTKNLELFVKGVAPKISGSLASGKLNEPYSSGLKANFSNVTWAISGKLPDGLDFDKNTGKLSGTPSEVGKFTLYITAENDGELSTPKKVTLTVKGTAPKIKTTSLKNGLTNKNGVVGEYYRVELSATGSNPITWEVQNLPDGLNHDGNNIIEGKPKEACKNRVVVLIAKNPVKSVTKKIKLTITEGTSSKNIQIQDDTAENQQDTTNNNSESEQSTEQENLLTHDAEKLLIGSERDISAIDIKALRLPAGYKKSFNKNLCVAE